MNVSYILSKKEKIKYYIKMKIHKFYISNKYEYEYFLYLYINRWVQIL